MLQIDEKQLESIKRTAVYHLQRLAAGYISWFRYSNIQLKNVSGMVGESGYPECIAVIYHPNNISNMWSHMDTKYIPIEQIKDALTWATRYVCEIKGVVVAEGNFSVQIEDLHKTSPDDLSSVEWKHLKIRNDSELAIAKALEEFGVMFFPNSWASLGEKGGRVIRSPDFLVCTDGKWGILEVDGTSHTSASKDHERDRLFRKHGIRVIEHYDAGRCVIDPGGVVDEFLKILEKLG